MNEQPGPGHLVAASRVPTHQRPQIKPLISLGARAPDGLGAPPRQQSARLANGPPAGPPPANGPGL